MSNNPTYAAVIGCNMDDYLLEQLSIRSVKTYHWKKIVPPVDLATVTISNDELEMANSINSIVEDDDITVVFISPKYLTGASKLIKAGKHVRVV